MPEEKKDAILSIVANDLVANRRLVGDFSSDFIEAAREVMILRIGIGDKDNPSIGESLGEVFAQEPMEHDDTVMSGAGSCNNLKSSGKQSFGGSDDGWSDKYDSTTEMQTTMTKRDSRTTKIPTPNPSSTTRFTPKVVLTRKRGCTRGRGRPRGCQRGHAKST